MSNRVYNAKVLLFGEQTVLFGSEALSIPYGQYHGQWRFIDDQVDQSLLALINRLDGSIVDNQRFKSAIEKGLHFASSIPLQHGLGSSGALTAAIYQSYGLHDISDSKEFIKSKLASIESVFHGQSSGIDALVSYTDQAVWKNDDGISLLSLDKIKSTFHFYLIDSQVKRSAKTYIDLFRELVVSKSIDIDALNQNVNDCIEGIISPKNEADSKASLMTLSELQFQYLKDFMPAVIQDIWALGLQDEIYFMKLCGAGGGGYFILMSEAEIEEVNGQALKRIF